MRCLAVCLPTAVASSSTSGGNEPMDTAVPREGVLFLDFGVFSWARTDTAD